MAQDKAVSKSILKKFETTNMAIPNKAICANPEINSRFVF
jgi:hypothetical protein